jgi:hypothetical protein
MATTRNDWVTGPSAADITFYQNDATEIKFYPFGTTPADLPAAFASYNYIIDVWQGTAFGTLLLTSTGSAPITTSINTGTGLVTFTLPRANALALTWTSPQSYDIREIDNAGGIETLLAGTVTLVTRGSV